MTCGTGGGHNTAARALQEEMLERGHSVQVINPYDLKNRKLSWCIDHGYMWMARRAPWLFGLIYKLGEFFWYLPFRSPVHHLNRLMVPVMQRYLAEHPCDVALMTHFFPSAILTAAQQKQKNIPPNILIATDYTCIPLTEEYEADAYITPAVALTNEFLRRGKPAHQIKPLGIPVCKDFLSSISAKEARSRLGLQEGTRYLLIAGGSIGAGKSKPSSVFWTNAIMTIRVSA